MPSGSGAWRSPNSVDLGARKANANAFGIACSKYWPQTSFPNVRDGGNPEQLKSPKNIHTSTVPATNSVNLGRAMLENPADSHENDNALSKRHSSEGVAEAD